MTIPDFIKLRNSLMYAPADMLSFVEKQPLVIRYTAMRSQMLIEKFIYSCSHDLRAPVSSIQGLVRIAQYYPQHEEIHKCLEMIEACTHKMDKTLSTLQEYMTNNQRPLHVVKLDPKELMQEVKTEFRNQLDTFNIDLICELQPEVLLFVDKVGMQKILKYLISNSIAFYNPKEINRKIVVKVEAHGQHAVVEVTDNGMGISTDQQERIFDIFFRGTEGTIGLGMGLFLAKSLTENMNGSIACSSTPEEGTTMRMVFPREEVIAEVPIAQ